MDVRFLWLHLWLPQNMHWWTSFSFGPEKGWRGRNGLGQLQPLRRVGCCKGSKDIPKGLTDETQGYGRPATCTCLGQQLESRRGTATHNPGETQKAIHNVSKPLQIIFSFQLWLAVYVHPTLPHVWMRGCWKSFKGCSLCYSFSCPQKRCEKYLCSHSPWQQVEKRNHHVPHSRSQMHISGTYDTGLVWVFPQ